MMDSHALLVNVDELWLKQGKRPYYMKALKKHLMAVMQTAPDLDYTCHVENQRFVVRSDHPITDSIIQALTRVPGIHSVSPAVELPVDEALIVPTVLRLLEQRHTLPATFAVRTHRANKSFSTSSMALSRKVGSAVCERYPQLKVQLGQPELTIAIKITFQHIFISTDVHYGVGGIPVGTSGHVVSLLSGGFDSPVATYLMNKRGCQATLVFFHAYPFVGDEVKDKIKQLAQSLARFQQRCELYIVPFGEIQQAIAASCKTEYRTLLFRHYMIIAADQLAHRVRADALCMGDALSQVSSQTMQNIAILDRSVVRPILRPLIGLNKSDILAMAREIGTHDISVIAQADACSLLAPKHPVVKPYHPYWTYFTLQHPFMDEIQQALDAAECLPLALLV